MVKNNDNITDRYQYCILKCVSDTYHKDMYIDDCDCSGYSHVQDREYARPYILFHVYKTLQIVHRKTNERYEPIPIDMKDNKWHSWNWMEFHRLFRIFRKKSNNETK